MRQFFFSMKLHVKYYKKKQYFHISTNKLHKFYLDLNFFRNLYR